MKKLTLGILFLLMLSSMAFCQKDPPKTEWGIKAGLNIANYRRDNAIIPYKNLYGPMVGIQMQTHPYGPIGFKAEVLYSSKGDAGYVGTQDGIQLLQFREHYAELPLILVLRPGKSRLLSFDIGGFVARKFSETRITNWQYDEAPIHWTNNSNGGWSKPYDAGIVIGGNYNVDGKNHLVTLGVRLDYSLNPQVKQGWYGNPLYRAKSTVLNFNAVFRL